MRIRGLWFRLILAVFLALLAPCGAAPGVEEAESSVTTLDEPAPLTIGPRVVVIFRSSVYGYTPKARVEASNARIRDALADDRSAEFRTVVRTEGTQFYYGEHQLFAITHQDLDRLTGQTMEDAVSSALFVLKEGFAQAKRGRDPAVLAWGVGRLLLFSLVYVALLTGFFSLDRKVFRFLTARFKGDEGRSELIVDAIGIARRLIYAIVLVGLTLAWLSLGLQSFPQTETAGNNLTSTFAMALTGLITAFIESMPNMLIAAVIFALSFAAVHGINILLKAVLRGRVKLPGIDNDVARPTATMLKLLLIVVGIITAFPYLPGTSSEAFQGISLMLGLIVSLGSATLFGQISAGFVLMYSGAFRRGDWLSLGDGTEGRLVEIGYLTTKIQTFREEISVPNLVLLGQATRNLSRAPVPGVAPLLGQVTIGYNAPWRQVYRLLQEAAAKTGDVLVDPAPVVHQVDLGDFYVTYELTAYISRETPRRIVRSNLFENIQDVFNMAGVQIMSPHYEGDPEGKVFVPPEKWEGERDPDAPAPPADLPIKTLPSTPKEPCQ